MRIRLLAAVAALAFITACGGPHSSSLPATPAASTPTHTAVLDNAFGKIDHVVIVIQENRTFDNLFNGFPGSDTVTQGYDHNGNAIALQPVSLAAPEDPSHSRSSLVSEWNNGAMNGFDLDPVSTTILGGSLAPPDFVYAYVPQSETTAYWQLAQQFAVADRMFSSQIAPSFPGHQFLIAGQAGRVVSDPAGSFQTNFVWGCDSPSGSTIDVLNAQGQEVDGGAPCLDYQTLGDLLDAQYVSWKYYSGLTDGYDIDGQVSAYDAIRHIRYGPDWSAHVPQDPWEREYQFFDDVNNGVLPAVSWLTPPALASDHAGTLTTWGPDWVGSVVNAIETSAYANDTAILITWDDSGGWYDHVRPPSYDGIHYGFRVPLIVVSPYTKHGYVSHVTHDFGSILHFVEDTFHLGSLGQVDATADDLSDMFDFTISAQARRHRMSDLHLTIHTPLSTIRAAKTTRPLDDDK